MTMWRFQISLAPGGPGLPVLREVYAFILDNHAFFPAHRFGDGGDQLWGEADPAKHIARCTTELYSRPGFSSTMTFYGPGPLRLEKLSMSFSFHLDRDGRGSAGGLSPAKDLDTVVEGVAGLCRRLEAPIAHIMTRQAYHGWDARRRAQIAAARATLGNEFRSYLRREPMVGIAFRTIMNRAIVDRIGTDVFSSLPERLAERRGKCWVLSGASAPEDWSPDSWCAQEREIIALLGADRFFNPETGSLSQIAPPFPEAPSVPHYFKDQHAGAPEASPAGALPDLPPPPTRVSARPMEGQWCTVETDFDSEDFCRMAATASQHMCELVAEFWDDAPVYWVDEFMRARRSSGGFDTYRDNFGAWLGEYMRDFMDGDWKPDRDAHAGWVIATPDGARHDPFALIASIDESTAINDHIKAIAPDVDFVRPNRKFERS